MHVYKRFKTNIPAGSRAVTVILDLMVGLKKNADSTLLVFGAKQEQLKYMFDKRNAHCKKLIWYALNF